MTSEIRTNTIKNRVGLGTISFTNTGPVVSGIVTATSFSGPMSGSTGTFSGNVDINGDLDVDGHTDLDNVSIAGVTTVSNNFIFDNGTNAGRDLQWQPSNDRLAFFNDVKATFGNGADLQIYHAPSNSFIKNNTGTLNIQSDTVRLTDTGLAHLYLKGTASATELYHDNNVRLTTTDDGITVDKGVTINGIEGGDAQIRLRADQGDDNNDMFRFVVSDGGGGLQIQGYDGSFQSRISVDTNGNIGINDTTPSEKLDVGGAIQASQGYKTAGHPILAYASFTDIGSDNYATRVGSTGTSTLRHTQIYGGGSHIATFDGANKRLGINETSPDDRIEIRTTAHGQGVTIKSTGNTSNALTFDANRGTEGVIGNVYGRWNGTTVAQMSFISGLDGTDKNDGDITFGTESAASNGNVNATERVRIKSDGKVGIGTNSPQKLLELQHATNRKLQFSYDDNIITIKGANNNGNPETIRLIGGNSIRFHTGATGSGTEKVRIDSSGQITNTGIDTSFVTTMWAANFAKLDIRGTNIANSNHYLISYGEGHAQDHEFHMVNTLGDLVFRAGTGSNERFYIKSDGKVGVGIDPTVKFHIKLSSRTSDFRITDSNTSADVLRAGSQPDGDGMLQLRTTGGAGPVLFDASGVSYIAGGNFGINRTDPDQKLCISGNAEFNAYDNTSGGNGYYTAKGLIIGNAYDAGKTSTDDRNSIIWNERGLDLDFATSDTLRMKIDHNGNIGMGEDEPNRAKLHVRGANSTTSIIAKFRNPSGDASSKTKVALVTGYGDHNQDTEGHAYIGAQRNSTGNTTDLFFETSTGTSVHERLRIRSGGGLQIGNIGNVSGFSPTTSGITGGLVLTTPVYSEYHYTWSGHSSYTIDLTCASYFHSEFIYVQHQTNGGSRMQKYIRGQWSNNHYQHSCKLWNDAGSGGGLGVTFVASDQSGGGAIDGQSNRSGNGSTYTGFVNGGGENSSTTANGRLRITETYNWGSVSSRGLIVRCYYGSFAISKS